MPEEASSMPQFELRDYLGVLRRRKWVIILTVLVVVGIGLALSLRQEKVYTSRAEILLLSENADAEIETQIRVLQSDAVREMVLKEVPDAGIVGGGQSGKSTVLVVSASSNRPDHAAQVVNAYVKAYTEFRRTQAVESALANAQGVQTKIADLQRQIDALNNEFRQGTTAIANKYLNLPGAPGAIAEQRALEDRILPRRNSFVEQQVVLETKLRDLQVDSALTTGDVKVVTPASVPGEPSSPNPEKDAITALGAGLLLGILLAFLFEYLDDTIKNREDLARAIGPGVPILGAVPAVPRRRSASKAEVISLTSPRSPAAEAYRSLRTSVQLLGPGVNSLQITSPGVREGKTTTLANLGVVMATAGKPVIMLDTDLRRPRMHEFFGLSNAAGFSSVMQGHIPLESALQSIPDVEGLSLLPSGPVPSNPSELLSSTRFAELLAELKSGGAIVLVDSPPLLPVTDASVLASLVDATLLVVAAGRTTRKQAQRAFEHLRQIVNVPVVGAVLNQVPPGEFQSYEAFGVRSQEPRGQDGDALVAPAGLTMAETPGRGRDDVVEQRVGRR